MRDDSYIKITVAILEKSMKCFACIIISVVILLIDCRTKKEPVNQPSVNDSNLSLIRKKMTYKNPNVLEFCYRQEGLLAVYGKYDAGLAVVLSNDTSCKFITGPDSFLQGESNDDSIKITKLIAKINCYHFDSTSIAIINPEIQNLIKIVPTEISDPTTITTLDSIVRTSREVKRLLIKSTDKESSIGFEDSVDISVLNTWPKVSSFTIQNKNIYVLEMHISSENNGPRFVVIGNSVFGLTGACSFPVFSSFELNGKYFLYTGSFCCGCGINGEELFLITADSVTTVKSNFAWSD